MGELIEIIEWPDNFVPGYHQIAFNQDLNSLYIHDSNDGMTIVNIKTKKFRQIQKECQATKINEYLVNIDGVIHLFAGDDNLHYIWNDDEQKNENNRNLRH